jgi:hypothetical protein
VLQNTILDVVLKMLSLDGRLLDWSIMKLRIRDAEMGEVP